MDAERISIAETCLHAAHDKSLSFPEIVGKLIAAGFDAAMGTTWTLVIACMVYGMGVLKLPVSIIARRL
jgi:hypothetical protein